MSNSRRKFFILWLLANTLSFVIPPAIMLSIIDWSSYWPISVLIGACLIIPTIAFAQWLVLGSFFDGFRWWIPATIGGGILAFLCANSYISLLAFPLLIGFMQSLVVKQRFVDEIWWVLSSTLGFFFGLAAYLLLWRVSGDNPSTMSLALRSVAISFSMGGAVYAAVTGMCIIWLERRTIVKNRNQ
jgi:hypothetical protein